MVTRTPDGAGTAARNGVSVAFLLLGFAFASWASRIPAVREQLGISTGQLGLVLLALSAGSIVAPPLAGGLVARFGTGRVVAISSLVLAVALSGVGLAQLVSVVPTALALAVFGFCQGTWDVAMNVEGAAVEQRLGRTIMPRFHAGFSLGAVGGALVGAVMVFAGVPVAVHLLAVAVLVAATVPAGASRFLASDRPVDRSHGGGAAALAAWREPRTLLIGVFVLAMAFTEGTGNDWLALGVVDGYRAQASVGVLTYAAFVAAMTAGRWFGTAWVDRWGRVVVLRISGVVALVGLVIVIAGPALGAGAAVAGAVLWGLGAALGFPMGMSAAADDPSRAAARVSVVASIGYTAFLGGPPLIGLLADHVGVLRALTVAAGLLVVALLVAGSCRAPEPRR